MEENDEDGLDRKEIECGSGWYDRRTETNYRNKKYSVLWTRREIQHVYYQYYGRKDKRENRRTAAERNIFLGNTKKLFPLSCYEETKRLADRREDWFR